MHIFPRSIQRLDTRPALAFAVAVFVIAVTTSCKSLTDINPSFPNITDSTIFFAINGSPPGSPTAVNLFTISSFRANQAFAYDLAFDIDSSGNAVIIPSRALATNYSAPYDVGLQVVPNATFLSLTSAPSDGYRLDTAVVVVPGQVVAVESHDLANCQFAIKGQSYFSKLIVTKIDLVNRMLNVTLTVNRNCGFHSFADGLPKD